MKLKQQYRMFRRNGVFYVHDSVTGKQTSLGTKERTEAHRLFNAKNEAVRQPVINLQIARAYLMVSDGMAATRTWKHVMGEIVKLKKGETQRRWKVATQDKAFADIQNLPLLETRAEHFLRTMEKGKVSTNIYLRRIHNFALGMNWLPVPVIQKVVWPKFEFKKKRAITLEEHGRILEREKNAERKSFYELLWFTGASQSDVAFLEAENVDWENKIIAYTRKKTDVAAFVKFGPLIEQVLKKLPLSGPFFPYLRTVRAGDRATEFKQRCVGLGIEGVTLHSYRYAWAERARKAGMPERYAQDSLGHSSKAVTRAYAGKAKVVAPALETYEELLGRPHLTVLPEVARVS